MTFREGRAYGRNMAKDIVITFDTTDLSRRTAAEFRLMADAIDEASAKRARERGVVKSTSGVAGHTVGDNARPVRDYSRDLCGTAALIVGHYRGSGDHLAPEEMADLVTFLRGRLAAWVASTHPTGASAEYDAAIREVVEAALAMHDANEDEGTR